MAAQTVTHRPVTLYGPVILALPIGFVIARTLEEQLDVLYSVADNPQTPRHRAEQLLRIVRKLWNYAN